MLLHLYICTNDTIKTSDCHKQQGQAAAPATEAVAPVPSWRTTAVLQSGPGTRNAAGRKCADDCIVSITRNQPLGRSVCWLVCRCMPPILQTPYPNAHAASASWPTNFMLRQCFDSLLHFVPNTIDSNCAVASSGSIG